MEVTLDFAKCEGFGTGWYYEYGIQNSARADYARMSDRETVHPYQDKVERYIRVTFDTNEFDVDIWKFFEGNACAKCMKCAGKIMSASDLMQRPHFVKVVAKGETYKPINLRDKMTHKTLRP